MKWAEAGVNGVAIATVGPVDEITNLIRLRRPQCHGYGFGFSLERSLQQKKNVELHNLCRTSIFSIDHDMSKFSISGKAVSKMWKT